MNTTSVTLHVRTVTTSKMSPGFDNDATGFGVFFDTTKHDIETIAPDPELTDKEQIAAWTALSSHPNRVIKFHSYDELITFIQEHKIHVLSVSNPVMSLGDTLEIKSIFGRLMYTEFDRTRVLDFNKGQK